ncbi:hypothetical protein KUTeg_007484 [Tegillarca granosa]|uniref:Nuclear receptor interaction protein n=1 Tax=Tegillarca granosa TaxID=220873 RepID=A0ABQ9FDF0_TEGGR|nr:hypothetical protein KUTeg_007484 [Tegillarca granosa]
MANYQKWLPLRKCCKQTTCFKNRRGFSEPFYTTKEMFQPLQSRSYGFCERTKLYNVAKDNVDFVQRLKLQTKLECHTGCVNTICWNDRGTQILSGSDDQHLVFTDPFTKKKILSIRSGHRANIFSAKYLPNTGDKQVVSCSGDGKIYYTDVERTDNLEANLFDCHFGTTYEDVLINCRRAVTSLAVNPVLPYQLGIACSDSSVRIFDRRMLGTRASGNYTGRGINGMLSRFTAPTVANRSYRITSLNYSPNGNDVLVSYSSEYIYLFGTKVLKQSFDSSTPESSAPESNVQDSSTPPVETVKKPSNKTSTKTLTKMSKISSAKPPVEQTAGSSFTAEPEQSQPSTSGQSLTSSQPTESQASSSEDTAVGGATGGSLGADTRQPPVKRLRLRGDWSDTGPNARPESERQSDNNVEERRNPHTSLMQRMSDMLTRWLDGNLLRASEGGERPSGEGGNTDNQMEEPPQPVLPQDVAMEENQEAVELTVGNSTQEQSSEGSQVTSENRSNQEDCSQETSSVSETEKTDQKPDTCVKTDFEATKQTSSSVYPLNDIETKECEVVKPAVYNLPSESNTGDTTTSHSDAQSLSVQIDDSPDNSPNSSLYTQDSVQENHDETSNSPLSGHSAPPESPHLSESHSPESETLSQLEPVISLHYSTQGTSSSTVRLGFAKFENLEAGVLQRSAENASLEPFVRETTHQQQQLQQQQNIPTADTTQGNEQNEASSLSMETEDSIESPNSSVDNTCVEMNDSAESCKDNNVCKIDSQEDNSMEMDNLCSDSASNSQQKKEENESRTLRSKSRIPCLVHRPKVKSSEDEVKACKASSYSQKTESTEGQDEEVHEAECSMDTEMHSVETGDGKEIQNSGDDTTNSKNVTSTQNEDTASTSNHDNETAERTSPPQSSSNVSTGTRQRRIGRSGPPTGNFQLSLNEDSSDNESEGTPRRNRDTHHTLERHVNAIRLQELYRKRQEEKEKEEMEMKNIHQPGVTMKYKGHRNARTMIKEANFWGDNFVMSGSDCGHIFIWDRFTAKLVMLLEADRHVVNCLQPHPFDPILASSGIDYDVKIWTPLEEQPCFDSESAEEIMRRNEVMLEETRDTITVPAAFMLRVLASLNQIRAGRFYIKFSGRATSNRDNREENDSSSDSE